jgi:integrase/recombinase XerD
VPTLGHRLGYLPFDVGGAVRLPRLRSALAERIRSEADVHRLLALEPDARNRVLLRLASAGGLRVSEPSPCAGATSGRGTTGRAR